MCAATGWVDAVALHSTSRHRNTQLLLLTVAGVLSLAADLRTCSPWGVQYSTDGCACQQLGECSQSRAYCTQQLLSHAAAAVPNLAAAAALVMQTHV